MPRVNPRRQRNQRRAELARKYPVAAPPRNPAEAKPIRGVKLKTVSWLTMLFALACLAAFMAGRPPASDGRSAVAGGSERNHSLQVSKETADSSSSAPARHRGQADSSE
jgi:hypothetical protein